MVLATLQYFSSNICSLPESGLQGFSLTGVVSSFPRLRLLNACFHIPWMVIFDCLPELMGIGRTVVQFSF